MLHQVSGDLAVVHYPYLISYGSDISDIDSGSKCQQCQCDRMPELRTCIRQRDSACSNSGIVMIWIAVAVMVGACLAHHLGLSEAIARTVLKIAMCPKCLSFWSVLFILVIFDCSIFQALLLSISMAYLSHYFNLALLALNKLYDWLWQRGNR